MDAENGKLFFREPLARPCQASAFRRDSVQWEHPMNNRRQILLRVICLTHLSHWYPLYNTKLKFLLTRNFPGMGILTGVAGGTDQLLLQFGIGEMFQLVGLEMDIGSAVALLLAEVGFP